MITARPLYLRLQKRLGRPCPPLVQMAVRSSELCPAETQTTPQAWFDEEDLERVTGTVVSSDMDYELKRIRGGRSEHGATTVYVLEDVLLLSGHLFSGRSFEVIADLPVPFVSRLPRRRIDRAALAASAVGTRFFGDWLIDDLMRMILLEKSGALVSPQLRPWSQQPGYLSAVGVSVELVCDARLSELTVVDDRGQNSFKRKRYSDLRNRLHAAAGRSVSNGVMLMRGGTGIRRALVNEEELAESLRRRGIDCFEPSALDPTEVIRRCAGAAVVVGVEGSQLAHGFVAMAEGAPMVVVQPPWQFGNVFKDRCDCVGSRYGFVVGSAVGPDGSFRVDVAAVHRLLDRIQS